MKKTHKRLLGFAGLTLVAAMTVFAAFMPGPGAVAANSVTETVVVRVLSQTISVDITNPKNGEETVQTNQIIKFDYNNAKTITINIKHTAEDGTETTGVINYTPEEGSISGSVPINLYEEYGYGDFIIEIEATNADGFSDRDAIEFTLVPITGEAEQDENTDDVNVDLNYDTENPDIDYIEINVYDKSGNLIRSVSPVRVPRPTTSAKLPFAENNIPDGEYIIEITAMDINGNPIQPPYRTGLDYKVSAIPVPDTGAAFAGLNISKSDYLITGLIIFFLVGIFGAVFISKKAHDKKRR